MDQNRKGLAWAADLQWVTLIIQK